MALEGLQLGNYRLQRQIGRGSMGEIYVAEDVRLPRTVAVKVLHKESARRTDFESSEALRLFHREMQVVATLDHPGILPLLDFGEQTINNNALTYMVMPLRPEGSLQDWLKQQSGGIILPLQVVVHIIFQAASALQHAHNRRLIHMDVKPSNFLVRQREDHSPLPDLLLADFGIAKLSNPVSGQATISSQSTVRGTPSYMAPEQWYGKPVAATDQYALAMMAYLLLTGTLPFRGNLQHVMYQHVQIPPAPPSSHNPRIPQAVDQVILRALAKDPAQRYPSVQDFGSALQQAYLNGGQYSQELNDAPTDADPRPSFSGAMPPMQQASAYMAPQQQASFSAAAPPIQMAVQMTPPPSQGYPQPPQRVETPPPSGYQQLPPPRRNRGPLIIGSLLLLLVLVGGGLAAAYFTVWHKDTRPVQPTPLPNQPTATATIVKSPEGPPRLKSAYRGTLSSNNSVLGSHVLRFTDIRQDQDGKLTGVRVIDDVLRANFEGTIDKNGQIKLTVHQPGETAEYTGKLFPDGHLEGKFRGGGALGDGTWNTAADSTTPA